MYVLMSLCVWMCVAEPWRCLFFAQHLVPHMQAPLFVLNSRYDTWQTEYLYCGKQESDKGLVRSRIEAFGQLLAAALYTALHNHKDGSVQSHEKSLVPRLRPGAFAWGRMKG
jgi:hypothetical protein